MNFNLIQAYRRVKQEFKTKRLQKSFFKYFLQSNVTPYKVALGFAEGFWFSIMPTFGLGAYIAVFFAWKYKLNPLSAFIGGHVLNPLTIAPIYYATYRIGCFLTSSCVNLLHWKDLEVSVLGQWILGTFIVATVGAVLCYLIILLAVGGYRYFASKN